MVCGGKRDADNATIASTHIYDRMSGHWSLSLSLFLSLSPSLALAIALALTLARARALSLSLALLLARARTLLTSLSFSRARALSLFLSLSLSFSIFSYFPLYLSLSLSQTCLSHVTHMTESRHTHERLNTQRREQGPDMLRPRVSARAVVLNGEVYVVGGWDGRGVLQVQYIYVYIYVCV